MRKAINSKLARRSIGLPALAGGCLLTSWLALLCPVRAAPDQYPYVIVSQAQKTLRLQEGPSRLQVYPVGVGRRCASCTEPPAGTFRTGADPNDREFYLPERHEPAFHRGLPFMRLLGAPASGGGAGALAIHGPVTPTLIWGEVSAGCVRLRPADLRALYAAARRYPGLPVTFVSGADDEAERALVSRQQAADPSCPERAIGARRLRRLALGQPLHDRLCGAVDHWFALELSGGDQLTVQLRHGGGLRVELYGLRAISAIRRGRFGFSYQLPAVARNRGDRYLRVTATTAGEAPLTYNLVAEIGGGPPGP